MKLPVNKQKLTLRLCKKATGVRPGGWLGGGQPPTVGKQRIRDARETEMGFGANVKYHNRISPPANEGLCLLVSVISVLAVPFDFIT